MKNFNIPFITWLLQISTIKSNDQNPFLIATLQAYVFGSCEIIFVTANKPRHSFKSQEIGLPYQHIWASSAGMFVVSKNENNGVNCFYRLRDIHKLNSKQCSIALIYFGQFTSDLPSWLFETLTPRYVPIIRKDEDHFIFIADKGSVVDQLLYSAEFGQKIKFKIGLVLNSAQYFTPQRTILKTVQLYGENGDPKIITSVISPFERTTVQNLFPDTTKNFHGKRFRVANPKAPFYFEMKPDPNEQGNNIPLRGLYKVWLDVMMQSFNFTSHLFLSSLSGGTGKRLANGTWLGAVADVLSGKAEMVVYIGHIYNRHEFVEWSTPLTYEWLVFITHKPQSFYSPSSIFRPFPITLWIGFFASLVLICLTFQRIQKLNYREKIHVSYRKVLLYLLSSFLEQDADFYLSIMKLSPVRVLIAFWLLFALIISTAYRGKLVSLIAFPALTWVPSTFDDLANSDYRVGVNVLGKGGAAYSILSTSKSPVYASLFKKMEIYPDPAVCMREGLKSNIGCIMWKSVADSTEAKNFTDKFGRKPFRASEQTTSFIADGYVSQLILMEHYITNKLCLCKGYCYYLLNCFRFGRKGQFFDIILIV